MLDEKLLEILVCPKCKGELEYKTDENQLVCHACRLIYDVKTKLGPSERTTGEV